MDTGMDIGGIGIPGNDCDIAKEPADLEVQLAGWLQEPQPV